MLHPHYIKQIETETTIINLRIDGIVQLDLKPVNEIEIKNAQDSAIAMQHFALEKKIALLHNIDHYVTLDKDVREFWAGESLDMSVKCEAFVINNDSMKMVIKFYTQFNKPKRPTQIFTSMAAALNWLKGCQLTATV